MDNNSKYFDDFVWAVPISFSDPLSKCRFEQGDMLYDTKKTYEEPWGEALKIMNYSIQISFPSRAQTAKTNQEAEIVFSSNWDSEVVFDLYNYKVGKKEKITSDSVSRMQLFFPNRAINVTQGLSGLALS
ncbi:hypothetical protein YTPLAS21_21530 [Candidatus Nitrosocosmicus sp.]|nr:hypothetical protein YTPLAS21_21530 [Candidatus Nitrosocosmicus sp.]